MEVCLNFGFMSKRLLQKLGLLGLVTLLLCGFGAQAQIAAATTPALRFAATEFNFGKIPQGKPVYYNFSVVNTTGQALKIDNVQAACGCTTPEWSREAIAPGATAQIKVGYNAAAEGPFDKTITVVTGNDTQVLHIKGEVWRTPVTSAPPNASVLFLKKQLGQ